MTYITLFSGRHLDPFHPETDAIDIQDIAHALSLLCRGNGHVKFFYSVGQHSLACAREAAARDLSCRVQLGCLLHDASEAYLSDITRPVKQQLPIYREAETKVQSAVWTKYFSQPLTAEELGQIKEIDDDMLSFEFKFLMPEEINERYKRILSDICCEPMNPIDVEKNFLHAFEILTTCPGDT
ncbi:MAG: hypothetical protein IJP31_01315 [Lachnospiraceae bacterium]|nr:hypothetical protein [Lachnospiraceae bacterium]